MCCVWIPGYSSVKLTIHGSLVGGVPRTEPNFCISRNAPAADSPASARTGWVARKEGWVWEFLLCLIDAEMKSFWVTLGDMFVCCQFIFALN